MHVDQSNFSQILANIRRAARELMQPTRKESRTGRGDDLWGVCQRRSGDRVAYLATIGSHGKPVFKQWYAEKATAALAADMAKILINGESSVGRLNFPSDRNLEIIAIDFAEAADAIKGELAHQDCVQADAETKAIIRGLMTVVATSVRDYSEWPTIDIDRRKMSLRRLALMETRISRFCDKHTSEAGSTGSREVFVPDGDCGRDGAQGTRTTSPDIDASSRGPSVFGQRVSTASISPPLAFRPVSRKAVAPDDRRGRSLFFAPLGDYPRNHVELYSHTSASCESTDVTRRIDRDELLTRAAARNLLSLHSERPKLLKLRLGCTLKNLRYILLTQDWIYRLMNLERTIYLNGWSPITTRLDLLKGGAILMAHLDEWKIRRITGWDSHKSEVQLEDRTVTSPLLVSNQRLCETEDSGRYVLQELNYRIDRSDYRPLYMRDVVSFYYRLCCCDHALRLLNQGSDIERTLQELVQRLINEPQQQFVKGFQRLLDPMSFSSMADLSAQYQNRLCASSCSLQQEFRSWLLSNKSQGRGVPLEAGILRRAEALQPTIERTTGPRLRFEASNSTRTKAKPQFVQNAAPRRSSRLKRVRESNARVGDAETVDRGGLATTDAHSSNRPHLTAFSSPADVERVLRRVRRELRTH